MIHFYASGRHTYTFERFVNYYAHHLRGRMVLHSYASIDLDAPLEPGLHVLTDFERLVGPEHLLVRRLHSLLSSRPKTHPVVGNPSTWKGRLELLRVLHDEGINDFRAFPYREAKDVRYPAFVRWANEHQASLGDPVHSDAEVRERVRQAGPRRLVLGGQLLVVEQADARSPDGLFRKYSAMRIGDRIIPRHVLFSDDWITKTQGVVRPELLDEETAFVQGFDEHEEIRRIFDLAGMDYGRIDYSRLDGRLRVWEINSNPMVGTIGIARERRVNERTSADQVIQTLESLEPAADAAGPPLRWPLLERQAWKAVTAAGRRFDPKRL